MIQVSKVHDDYNSLVHKDFTHQQAVYWTARWHDLKESTVEELLTVPVGPMMRIQCNPKGYPYDELRLLSDRELYHD